MAIEKIVPAPFSKGVNFSNWLEHRPAEDIRADMFTREDFVNVKKLGCDVIRLPIHFGAGDLRDLRLPQQLRGGYHHP